MRKSPKRKQNGLQRKQSRKTSTAQPWAASITISIDLPSAKVAEALRQSLKPETRPNVAFRSMATVTSTGEVLRLRIRAHDLVALRAASNSLLRFVAVALRTVETIAPFYRGHRVDC